MPRPRLHSTDELAYKAAYLHAEHRLSQGEIAKLLGASQAAVSRALQRARELGCVEETYRFVPPVGLNPDVLTEVDDLLEFAGLRRLLASLPTQTGVRVRWLRVFDSQGEGTDHAAIDERQRVFGRAAAAHVASCIRRSQYIGVAWGSTLTRLVDGVGRAGFPRKAEHLIHYFIPVSAEPTRYARSEFTASSLARRLDTIVNGEQSSEDPDDQRRLVLTGVPAFVPAEVDDLFPRLRTFPSKMRRDLAKGMSDALRAFFKARSPAFATIFNEPDGLVYSLDMLLTSAGASERVLGFCHQELLEVGRCTKTELQKLVVGDLGGVLLARPELSKPLRRRVAGLSAMWTGINERQLEQLATRAELQGKPGTVVVALGRQRCDVIAEAVLRGLCNELIIDRDLARALETTLRSRITGGSGDKVQPKPAPLPPRATSQRKRRGAGHPHD